MKESEIQAVPVPEIRGKVAALEKMMLQLPQQQMEAVHHYAPGLYGKELRIPAGTLIVGKVHLQGHLNFLMEGCITVFTEQGMKRLSAPFILSSEAGMKRVGVTHTDTTWVTVHAIEGAELLEPDEVEKVLTVDTMDDYDELLEYVSKELLEGGQP